MGTTVTVLLIKQVTYRIHIPLFHDQCKNRFFKMFLYKNCKTLNFQHEKYHKARRKYYFNIVYNYS
jgi:hypothetical protein